MPVLAEADLVSYILPQEYRFLLKKTLTDKDWTIYRQARASISLHLLGRITQETDPNFDFNKVPVISSMPPTAADPKLRTEYEASISTDEAINDKRNQQLQLKQLNKTLVPQEEKYIVRLYSMAPYNPQELKRLLDVYITDAGTKQKIMDQVLQNTQSAK